MKSEKKIIESLTKNLLIADNKNVVDKIMFLLKHLRRMNDEEFN
jgi:hypothetical protein